MSYPEWRVRGPVARFHWDYLRGTLYTLCPVVSHLTVVLSSRASRDACVAMFRDLNWWSRLREISLVALRPTGQGMFGPGLSAETLAGLSELQRLRALTTEGCDASMALHAALRCPQLTKLCVRSRRSPLSPSCPVTNSFLDLLAASQRAICSGQPPPPPPAPRQGGDGPGHGHGQGQEPDGGMGFGQGHGGGGGGGADMAEDVDMIGVGGGGGGGGGGGAVAGVQGLGAAAAAAAGGAGGGGGGGALVDGWKHHMAHLMEGAHPALDLQELQNLFAEEGAEEVTENGDSDGSAADGDVEMEDAVAGHGPSSAGAGAAGRRRRRRGGGGGDAKGCRQAELVGDGSPGLRHLEFDSDAQANDAATLMSLLDAGSASTELVPRCLRDLLASLPRLQCLHCRRVPLSEAAVVSLLQAATGLTELHCAVQDGRVRREDPGWDPSMRACRVLEALAQEPAAALGPAARAGGTGQRGPVQRGPPVGPGRPALHLHISGASRDSPPELLAALMPLRPRLRTLFFSHRALTPAHMLSVGQLESLEVLGLSLSLSGGSGSDRNRDGVAAVNAAAAGQQGGAAAAMRAEARMRALLAVQQRRMEMEMGLMHRRRRAMIEWMAAARSGGGPPLGPLRRLGDAFRGGGGGPGGDLDLERRLLDDADDDVGDGGPAGHWDGGPEAGAPGLGLEALRRLTSLRELHIRGALQPPASVSTGYEARTSSEGAAAGSGGDGSETAGPAGSGMQAAGPAAAGPVPGAIVALHAAGIRPHYLVAPAAEALEVLTRDRLRLRRSILSLTRPDLAALTTHGSRLEALSLHYVRTPPDVVALLAGALPRLRRLSLRWANDVEAVPGGGGGVADAAQPCSCCGIATAGPSVAAATAGGSDGEGRGWVELSVLPPALESLDLGGAVSLAVTAPDPAGPGGSRAAAGPLWTTLQRLTLTDGLGLPDGALQALLAHTPYLGELQLLRPRHVRPADLVALEHLDGLRQLIVDLDSADLECRTVRNAFAEGISRVARLTALQELRWNVPEPLGARRRAPGMPAEQDSNQLLCQQLPALTGLQRLSLLSLPCCRTLLPRLDHLQALRHLPFLEISPV
ncbi:hypothetical protein GPECTOR_5g322 [Gonium pectorale]|uniref:F-box domain-containing protein n=1 Tax=Gonium pectorale TaxID=33097 RepID=A0A150GWJ8_GONPE|nr:hypothetical protein GPECTOR_5g322 [Gonium pectorale]|eukprot:KXZ54231.1 hypothetical protein GPECTOR_5g322 [Gonium pectorale]